MDSLVPNGRKIVNSKQVPFNCGTRTESNMFKKKSEKKDENRGLIEV
jgi:hypothetical protein